LDRVIMSEVCVRLRKTVADKIDVPADGLTWKNQIQ
jgi:hypothetical protein